MLPSAHFVMQDDLVVYGGLIVEAAAAAAIAASNQKKKTRPRGRFFHRRPRHSIHDVYTWMGESIFRCAFRMTYDSFWRLYDLLFPHIITVMERSSRVYYHQRGGRCGGNHLPPPVRNGPITLSMRLGMALRYFAGGSSYDIMCVFCVSYSEVLKSVWIIVDAVNVCPEFLISYPSSLEEQRRIAAEFEAASTPKIRNCAGAIDGILIWILKPSLKEAKSVGVDQRKFLCGRKHKFGLNCQAVSDCRGRILDISIKFGGSSSDCLAFEGSELYRRLDNGLLLHDEGNDRFVLFGDNAYLNTPFMATPFTNVSGDANCAAEDSYNFYHSQLRIRVECAFGMLVQRWGILRTAMPRNIRIQKITALVTALAKLHNFCISEADGVDGVPALLNRDTHYITNNIHGHVGLGNDNILQNTVVPTDLMHLGEHFGDVTENILHYHREQNRKIELPRTKLFNMIVDGHWERPTRLTDYDRRRRSSVNKTNT